MHLFSRDYLAASSGIVGAAGPAAAGFALAARYLRPGTIAVAFFGEGAMNQGMLMESMNLASVWNLPVLFVCKDDQWAITTRSSMVTGGSLDERARGLGLPYIEVNGLDVGKVWEAVQQAIEQIRSGKGPTFIHAQCVHLEGHFLGYQLLRVTRHPFREMPGIAGPLTRSLLSRSGTSLRDRLAGLRVIISALLTTLRDPRRYSTNDPVMLARAALKPDSARLSELENSIEQEIAKAMSSALGECVT
jgi:pyruvate dehydrogenase E1 component alpha subunit